MNWKVVAPALAAVVLGGAALKIARDSMKKNHAPVMPQQPVARVVMAKGPVLPGQELNGVNIVFGNMPVGDLPADAITDMNEANGRVATEAIAQGQPILREALAPKGANSGLAALVPNGKRAITINVTETSALAGMLAPSSRVDVVATLGDAQRVMAKTIVQNVLVQAVGQRLTSQRDPDDKKNGQDPMFRSVTLITTPQEAETIQLAVVHAHMTLVLRGVNDTQDTGSEGVTLKSMIGEDSNQAEVVPVIAVAAAPTTAPATRPALASIAPVVAPPPHRVVTFIRGTTQTQVEFELPRPPKAHEVADTQDPTDGGGQVDVKNELKDE